jgi:hypothetical protein
MNNTTEEVVETLQAMRRQEETGYDVKDYLALHQESCHGPLPNGPMHLDIDADSRQKMAQWCTQVVDFCKFSRDSVEIAMNFLDRFLSTSTGREAVMDRAIYQLAAMTCLYTTVKTHEQEAMDPVLVSNLSRGTYTPAQIEAMEASILGALDWRLNPPTVSSFVRQFLQLIPTEALADATKETVSDLTKLQAELALGDYDLMTVKKSTLAYCSLTNSLESMQLDEKVVSYISYVLCQASGIDAHSEEVQAVQSCLYSAVVARDEDSTATPPASPHGTSKHVRNSSIGSSPRSVSVMR